MNAESLARQCTKVFNFYQAEVQLMELNNVDLVTRRRFEIGFILLMLETDNFTLSIGEHFQVCQIQRKLGVFECA